MPSPLATIALRPADPSLRSLASDTPPAAAAPHRFSDAFLAAYEILSVLGAGGMGTVQLGRHRASERLVAIKTGHGAGEQDRERLLREGIAMARVAHPAVVKVEAAGEDDGLPFLIFEFVEGCTLRELMSREAPVLPGRAAQLLAPVLEGLEVCHRAGVIHRDLKPENLLVQDSPGGPAVKIADFGLTRFSDAGAMKTLTLTGQVMGTPTSMSPEQAMGERVGAASDVYAMGVVLYEMLCGAPPFAGPSPTEVLVMHIRASPAPLGERRSGIPAALADLVMRALAKQPEERWPSAGAMADALARFVQQTSPDASQPVRRPASASQARTVVASKPALAAPAPPAPSSGAGWLAGALAAAAGVLAVVALGRGPARPAPPSRSTPSPTTPLLAGSPSPSTAPPPHALPAVPPMRGRDTPPRHGEGIAFAAGGWPMYAPDHSGRKAFDDPDQHWPELWVPPFASAAELLEISPDQQLCASWDAKRVTLWDRTSHLERRHFDLPRQVEAHLSFDASGTSVLAQSDWPERSLRVWAVTGGAPVVALEDVDPRFPAALSPRGRRVLYRTSHTDLMLREEDRWLVALSSDATHAAAGPAHGPIVLYDLPARKPVARTTALPVPATDMEFSGETLLLTHDDGHGQVHVSSWTP